MFNKTDINLKGVQMKNKRLLIFIIFFVMIIKSITVYATNENILTMQEKSLGISELIANADEYIPKEIDGINIKEIFKNAKTGNISNISFIHSFFNLFGRELKDLIGTIGIIIVIIIIHSLLHSISQNLENKNVSKITYFVEYILIATLVLSNFSNIISDMKNTIQNLVGFSNSLIPILITLMLTTGSVASAGIMKPILLLLINLIGNIITNFILPFVLIGTALGIVSKISNEIQVGKLSKFFKSSTIWIIGIIMTFFVTVLSLEGNLTATVDGVTAKTTKAAVSTAIPVVGKILGDATDTVIGCIGILKNAVGIVGVVVIISICITPIIKLTILTITYYIASAICEPIADERIISLLQSMGDTFKTLLAIMFCMALLLIIGFTLVIKISNGTLLYR